NLSEFELHARAILGLPIPQISLERTGASAVILAKEEGKNPVYTGIEEVLSEKQTDVRIFNKPSMRPYRRMGVVLAYDKPGAEVEKVKGAAIELAKKIKVG